MNVKKVGEYIKIKRKEKGMTQKDLADKLCITDRAISKWERGICCPDISLLKELSAILDVSINELLSGEDIEKLEIEQSEDIIVETVKEYTAIEKKKRFKLWLLTIGVIVIDILFIFAMYLMYNQINGIDGMTINSIQNRYVTNKFLTLIENKDYEGLSLEVGDYYYRNGCSLKDDEYNFLCMLKELNDLGVEFVSHKYLSSFFNNLYDVAKYEVILRYEDKEEVIEIELSSTRGNLTGIYFNHFRVSSILTCYNLHNGLSWCYNENEQKGYYVWEMNLDSEDFFPKEINEKIVNLFSPNKYD